MARSKNNKKMKGGNGDGIGDSIFGNIFTWGSTNKKETAQNWFMDRQYTIKDSDSEKFKDYAREKGWYYKTYNNKIEKCLIFSKLL